MAASPSTESAPVTPRAGLARWMRRVLVECEKAGRELSPDVVHDLRVALRRCRSMAKSLMEVDPGADWRAMRKAGKRLFKAFGDLRDTQVMLEWVQKLAPADDPARQKMIEILADRDKESRESALAALAKFDRQEWKRLAEALPARRGRPVLTERVFEHLALECYYEAHALHRRAVRNRSRVAYHRLRIGFKRFRYTVENFLPGRRAELERDLKDVQDLLGEAHDLDVLWGSLLKEGVLADVAERARWREWIDQERRSRIEGYRLMTVGKDSRWPVWRASLPDGDELEAAAMAKLQAWASFRDPYFGDKPRIASLALQIFDGLRAAGMLGPFTRARDRKILTVAALLHDVGRAEGKKGHHKESARMIRELAPPLGWTAEEMALAALVARYHRGAPPQNDHFEFAALLQPDRDTVLALTGVLRLAIAFGRDADARVASLDVRSELGSLVIEAVGGGRDGGPASEALHKKWLLEFACRRPIVVRFRSRDAAGATPAVPSAVAERSEDTRGEIPEESTATRRVSR